MTTVETLTHSPPSRNMISKQRLEHYESSAIPLYSESLKFRVGNNIAGAGITLKDTNLNIYMRCCLARLKS